MDIQWPLVLFTLGLCAASGLLAVEGAFIARGKGRKAHMPVIAVCAILVVLGGVSSFFHLQHWERIFNGFGHVTSGITQELIAIVAMAVVLIASFAVARKTEEDGVLPAWLGIVSLVVGVATVLVSAHAYGMSARPAWDTVGTYLCFLGGAFVMGASLLWAIGAVVKDPDLSGSGTLTALGGIIALVCLVAFCFLAQAGDYEMLLSYSDPILPTSEAVSNAGIVSDAFFGGGAWMFWGVAVVVGAAIPLALGLASRKMQGNVLALSVGSAACALVGGAFFRAVFFLVGVSSFGIAF
ncbi:hypothetical protein QUW41_01175 [Slackia piriformis]|nr:hypothetical protein [Slackia piriformis]